MPLTSFVVMSLASTGRAEHPVTRHGVGFLLDTVRADGSWPIDTNLAVWNTTLADPGPGRGQRRRRRAGLPRLAAWSASTGGYTPSRTPRPGGWGWSDPTGAVPDADDTAGALLALAVLLNSGGPTARQRIEAAALAGVDWLLALAKRRRRLAHLLPRLGNPALRPQRRRPDGPRPAGPARLAALVSSIAPIDEAIRRGLSYLARQQRPDGSWVPLWFGNQHYPGEENPSTAPPACCWPIATWG